MLNWSRILRATLYTTVAVAAPLAIGFSVRALDPLAAPILLGAAFVCLIWASIYSAIRGDR